MIVHEAIGVAQPMRALDDLGEQGQKGHTIRVIGVDGRPGIAPTGDMIQGAREGNAQGSCHGCPLKTGGIGVHDMRQQRNICNMIIPDLTLFFSWQLAYGVLQTRKKRLGVQRPMTPSPWWIQRQL
jgi:hypothetical protein